MTSAAEPRAATRALRAQMRRQMFLSQDGVVLCATLRALDELGILETSLEQERALTELYPGLTPVGFGALRIALHGLHSTGWLAQPPALDPAATVPRWTERGRRAARQRRDYVELGDLLVRFPAGAAGIWSQPWSPDQTERFERLVERAGRRWGLAPAPDDAEVELLLAHLDSGVTVPMMLTLHETERLGESGPELAGLDTEGAFRALLEVRGWTDALGGWTPLGLEARRFALSFGGVATYLPLLARLADLYRGELTVDATPGEEAEWHVNRELNLRISAGAHARYFADSDPIFREIFDREPLAKQPRFIADMGCGDGSWLIHLDALLAETRRGKELSSRPLTLVAVDPDRGAREQATRNLAAAGVEALVISGDVTHPEAFAGTLAEHGLAIEDGLHIRSFIDHERTYVGGENVEAAPGWASGAYIDGDGDVLSAAAVERDLVAHLRRWRPHVSRHGMVVLEAHCVEPTIVSRHLGLLHGLAFDAHQAYSKQSPVDHAAFLRCCAAAGLRTVGAAERRYPPARPFVSISLNRVASGGADVALPAPLAADAARADTWTPAPDTDLEDGEALHRILFQSGDIRYPAAWGSAPTGYVVAATLAALEERLASADAGTAIRVLDYGAGTGTATIALLEALQERDYERRLRDRDLGFEIHLVDLPSSWFAKGFELLRGCGWTRFHSLRGKGGFRPLTEVVDGAEFDAAMANMVFHLIPPPALRRAADDLAAVLSPGGPLAWSAPDLGPAGKFTVPLHEPNRLVRQRWLELLAGDAELPEWEDEQLLASLAEALRRAHATLDEEGLSAARERADRRILPRPLAADAVAALETVFEGETTNGGFEMRGEEIVAGLLVPSNQAEYLPEIPDRALREDVVRGLMEHEALPTLRRGPAATGLGLNLQWTLGTHRRPA
jgi:SAM-dependent methyltransferase